MDKIIVIEVQALERCLIEGSDEIVKLVIFFRGFLKEAVLNLRIYGGQFKEQHRKQGNAGFSALFIGSPVMEEPLHVELRG